MPYGPTDYSTIDRWQTAAADFSDRQAQAATALNAMRERASDKKQAMDALNYVATQDLSKRENLPKILSGVLPALNNGGDYSQQALGHIGKLVEAARLSLPDEPKPQWLNRSGTTVNDIPKPGDMPYERDKETLPKEQWLLRNGKPVYDIYKPGDSPYDKSKAGGRGLTDKEDLAKQKALAKKDELFQRISVRHPQANFDAILAGTEPIPIDPNSGKEEMVPKYGPNGQVTMENDEAGVPRIVMEKKMTGQKQDKDVLNWLSAIGQSQSLMKQGGDPYFDAQENARMRVGAGAPSVTSPAKSEDDEALNWARQNPNDPRSAKILQLLNGGTQPSGTRMPNGMSESILRTETPSRY